MWQTNAASAQMDVIYWKTTQSTRFVISKGVFIQTTLIREVKYLKNYFYVPRISNFWVHFGNNSQWQKKTEQNKGFSLIRDLDIPWETTRLESQISIICGKRKQR